MKDAIAIVSPSRGTLLSDLICRDVYRGDVLSLQVLDRIGVRACSHREPYAVISITDPNLEHPSLARSEFRRAVLPLRFYDIDGRIAATRVGEQIVGFTAEMARQIRDFVEAQRASGVSLMIVNCEFGMSRSAGVASALSFFYNYDETFFLVHYQPNSFVRRLVLEALRSGSHRDGES